MKKAIKIILILIFLTISCQCYAQISLGEDENTVYNFLYDQVNSYNRSHGDHDMQTFDVRHYNGAVIEIIISMKDGYLYDLGVNSDLSNHYIMKNGRLSYILTQYANISIENFAQLMSKSYTKIGNYYFGNDDNTYSIIYLSAMGLVTKEFRSQTFNPIPENIRKQLMITRQQKEEQREQANESTPFDPTKAVNYDGFSEQENKIMYSVWQGLHLNQKVNTNYLVNASSSIKAVIAYYSGISYAYKLTEKLNLGPMCSNELTSYISKYFNNNRDIMNQLSECKIRGIGNEYSLERLELSEYNGRITASYAMTYYKNNRSQDDVIGVDEFKINPDQSLTILSLSSKESIQKKSTAINSQVYDVQKTAPDTYENFKIELKNELIRVLKAGNRDIPSFQDFFDNIDKSNFSATWSLSNNYNLNWSTSFDDAGYRQIVKNDTINKGVDKDWILLWSCKVGMPFIKVDGVNAKFLTLTVKNIEVDFTKGISLAKIKDDAIEYSKYPPPPEMMEKIKAKVIGAHYKGYFLITYELGNVMGENYEDINFEKIKNNIYKTPDGWIIRL